MKKSFNGLKLTELSSSEKSSIIGGRIDQGGGRDHKNSRIDQGGGRDHKNSRIDQGGGRDHKI